MSRRSWAHIVHSLGKTAQAGLVMIGAEQRAVKGAMRVLCCRRTLQRREARAEEKPSGSGGD